MGVLFDWQGNYYSGIWGLFIITLLTMIVPFFMESAPALQRKAGIGVSETPVTRR
jgi:hypothetical protein